MPKELNGMAGSHIVYQVYYGDGLDDRNLEEPRAALDQDPRNRERADRDKAILAKYGAWDWYDWCCGNWGTKSQPRSVEAETNAHVVKIDFLTAWSFPEPIFRKLAEMFPSLRFCGHAVEHGNAWALDFEADNGNLIVVYLDYRKSHPVEAPDDAEAADICAI